MLRILNRSFMVDREDRLQQDGILVRFEDGKLNPKATFTALAEFLDLPYTESMTYCSEKGVRDVETMQGNVVGFDPATVYRTYDEYANDAERYFIEYFLRDAYEYYGYDFHYYDGAPVDEEKIQQLVSGFTTLDHYISESYWNNIYGKAKLYADGKLVDKEVSEEVRQKLLADLLDRFHRNRINSANILLSGLYMINRYGQPLRMMPMLKLDPDLLEQPLYH